MKRMLAVSWGLCLLALLVIPAAARDVANPGLRPARICSSIELSEYNDPGLARTYESAAVDTYCIVWYNFEQMNWQGWTREDNTAQKDTFWHVDDFAGLDGGIHGGLAPIGGTKSMWCGARPGTEDDYLCSWAKVPGYGNLWDQYLTFGPFSFSGRIAFTYSLGYDSEPGYDFTDVEYDAGGYDWGLIASYTGRGSDTRTVYINLTTTRTKLRFHMYSDGAWSDEDGLWDTDGAAIVDDITIADGGSYSCTATFEDCAVGQTTCDGWNGTPGEAYGTYSGLKNNLADKDPCGDNYATQIVFFIGSIWPSPSYPGDYETPFCKGSGGIEAPCQNEQVVSPVIDMTKYSTLCNQVQNGAIPAGDLPFLGGARLSFTVYEDLPHENLVFYQWRVRSIADDCPGLWRNNNLLYYGDEQAYIGIDQDVSSFIGSNESVQIAIGCVDMCDVWYAGSSTCAAHTPSPWIDNVRLYRYKSVGPQWSWRAMDLFQDNFPSDKNDLESYVRMDAAIDINPPDNPVIRPGDSIVVTCSSPHGGGIATDPTYGGPAVYLHVRVTYVGPEPLKPNLFGPSLQGSYGRYISDDGEWTVIQCDTARIRGGGDLGTTSMSPAEQSRFAADINDSLLMRGYEVHYYFSAQDVAGEVTRMIEKPLGTPWIDWVFLAVTLPTPAKKALIIIKVGEWVGKKLCNLVKSTKKQVEVVTDEGVDVYKATEAPSGIPSGIGSRAAPEQLEEYQDIIIDTGPLESYAVSDGTMNSNKGNDCEVLVNWMKDSPHPCGLWICGDGAARDLSNLASTQAIDLMSNWCGVDFVATSYFDLTGGRTAGGVVSPLITGEPDAGIFVHGGVPDKFYAYGGCPIINRFDVLEKTANGKYALSYADYGGNNYYAGIASEKENDEGYPVRTMWFGFSFWTILNDVFSSPMDRFEIERDVFAWFGLLIKEDITPAEEPKPITKLAQNFPNPFNPATTINYSVKGKGLVALKVYNVAGQLVRTLVNEVQDAGSHEVTWDGKNDHGAAAASGIYFYRMDTKGFSETKKIVLLR